MRILTTLVCISALSLLAPAQTPKAGSNPCALLTKAEVQAEVGAAVSDGVVNATNKLICDFKLGASGSSVSVMLTAKAPGDSAERTVAEMKKQKIGAEVTPGFGDSAYTTSPGFGMQQLGVYKGSSHVIVTALLMGTPAPKAKAITQAVMRKALARVQ